MDNIQLLKLKNGINLAYDQEIDYNNITDQLIDGIFDIKSNLSNIKLIYNDNEFANKICSYRELIQYILKQSSKEERSEIFSNINTIEYVENLRIIFDIYNHNITKDEITEILRKNKTLFKYNIYNIKSNYKHLRKQNIILNDELDKIYLDSSTINIDDVIKNIVLNKEKIPRHLELLLIPSTDENKDLLVKNLKYTVVANGIRYKEDVDENSFIFFNRNLFENIKALDQQLLKNKSIFLESSPYSKYFSGIKNDVMTTLNLINENLIKDLDEISKNNYFDEFFNSLITIKNWNNYKDDIKRAEDLRDEFITRILFGTIWDNCLNYSKKESNLSEDNIIKNIINSLNKQDNTTQFLDTHITESVINNITCMDINDFFDINIGQTKFKAKLKEKIRTTILDNYPPAIKFLKPNPYKLKENKKLSKQIEEDNKKLISNLKYSLLNPIVDNKKKEKIITETLDLITQYNNTNGTEKNKYLMNIIKNLNYYMIANNEYDILNFRQQNTHSDNYISKDVTTLPKAMLNTTNSKFKNSYNSMDRIMYYLYNSNRLAHSASDILVHTINDDPIVVNENRGITKNKIERYMVKYTTLSRYGLSVDWINESIEDYFNNSKINIYNLIDKYKENKDDLILYLKNSCCDKTIAKEEITIDNINNVIDDLIGIKDNPKNDLNIEKENAPIRESIEIYAKERNFFFNVKRFFIDEVVRRTYNESKKNLEDMNKNDKLDLFLKKGYIAEFQTDRKSEDVVLVCLNNKFNTPFSVHYVNRKKKFEKEKLNTNQEVSHYINQKGLTEKETTNFLDDSFNSMSIKSGFYDVPKNNKTDEAYQSKINNDIIMSNYININLAVPKNRNYSIDRAFQKIKDLLKAVSNSPINIDNKIDEESHNKIDNIVASKANESIKTIMKSMNNKDTKLNKINENFYEVSHNNDKILLSKDYIDSTNFIDNFSNKDNFSKNR